MNIEQLALVPKPSSVPDWITEARQGKNEEGNKVFALVVRLPDGQVFHANCLASDTKIEVMVNCLGRMLFEHEHPNQMTSHKGRPSIIMREARAVRDGKELSEEDQKVLARMRELSYRGNKLAA